MAGLTFALGAGLEAHDAVAFAARCGAAALTGRGVAPHVDSRLEIGDSQYWTRESVRREFPSVDVDTTLVVGDGAWATGVVVVTAPHPDGRDAGLVMVSLAPVSQEPPLVLWSVDRGSGSLDVWLEAPGFALHLLAADQEALAWQFARKGAEKFDGLEITPRRRRRPAPRRGRRHARVRDARPARRRRPRDPRRPCRRDRP